jgi:peptidoglycan/xylan/chitin deacetylase (PgdA/CDA1 family)
MKFESQLVLGISLIAAAQLAGVFLLVIGSTWIAISVFALSHAVLLFGSLRPNSSLFSPVQTKTTTEGVLYTFDDGPDPRTTPELLEFLKRHQFQAVFFVIGERAQRHPELVRAIDQAGHTIGNHTYTHPAHRFWCIGPWSASREIRQCDVVIQAITGKKPDVFRSPAGHSNPFTRLAVLRSEKRLMGWTARGFDGVGTPRATVLQRLRKCAHKRGSIILLHEAYDPAERGYSPAELLEDLLSGQNSPSIPAQ